MIPVYINNNFIFVPKTASVLEACEILSIIIPRFCFHSQFNIAGNCRMCLVEIEKSPKPIVSCATPITKNMKIYTNSPLVKKARENIIEFLLLNHPLDCPICDQAGECDLQEQTLSFGSDKSRFFEFKRDVTDKNLGPIVKTIMTRCIHCTRCLRFMQNIVGYNVLGSINRGKKIEIGLYIENSIQTELSGNLVDICPVGALTSKPFAFSSRPWELHRIETIDFSDSVGSNICIDIKENEIIRIQPKQNGLVNRIWLSDKARFYFDGFKTNRLNKIYFKSLIKYKMQIIFWDDLIIIIKNIIILLFLKNSLLNKINLKNKFYYSNFFYNFAIILNDFLSLENMFRLKYFCNCFGIKNFGNINLKKLNHNNDLNYLYSSIIILKKLPNVGFCVLIGTNPRFEIPTFNIQLKKRFSFGIFTVITTTPFLNTTFPVIFIGISNLFLIQITEAKTIFCKKILITKTAFYIGSSIFNRVDNNTFISMLTVFEKIVNKINIKVVINFINNHINSVGYYFCNLKGINKHYFRNIKILFSIEPQITKINNNGYNLFNNKNKIIFCNSFFGLKSKIFNCDLIIPANSFFEISGVFISYNNYIQKSKNVIKNTLNNINQNSILSLIKSLINLCYYNILKANYNASKNKIKHYFYTNKITFFQFFHKSYCFKKRLNRYPFILNIYDFYITCNFSLFSNILNKCSKINRIKHINFY